jgi:hypothetical protein
MATAKRSAATLTIFVRILMERVLVLRPATAHSPGHGKRTLSHITLSRIEGLIDLVQIVFLQRHPPTAEQLNTGAAIHGSLEGLQSVDLSFGLPVAPRLRYSVPHRLQVLAYRLRKTLHRVDPRRARIDQPSVQPLRRSTAASGAKRGDGAYSAANCPAMKLAWHVEH